jgi:hypothetical protein
VWDFLYHFRKLFIRKLYFHQGYLFFRLLDRKQAMTKSAKSRNGQTKTVSSNAPTSTKKKADKKGKGDSTSNDRSLSNTSNGKVKHRTSASVQSGGENEVSHPLHKQHLS